MKTPEETKKEVERLGWWYQHFEFPNGVRTGDGREPGYDARQRWEIIEPHVPKDLSGKTVLDLGGNAGYFSIQMKLRGASRCVLVDPFVEFTDQARFAAGQFDVELHLVNDDAHTFCLTTEERFDHVIFLGLLYHLKYPGLVLDRLAEMTKERIYINSHVIGKPADGRELEQDYAMSTDDALLEDPAYPKMMFIEHLYNSDPTNWWIPNPAALASLARSAGLKIVARPHHAFVVAEPETHFGKVVLPKLVFPRYGKRGGAVFPGPQRVDPDLWDSLVRRSQKRT